MSINHLSELQFLKYYGSLPVLTALFPKTAGSTNTLAADMFCGLPLLAATENQTAGRGTRGRSFECCEGKGLYMSFAMYEDEFNPDTVDIITPAVAVAVVRTLKELYGICFLIKWVNDIVFNDKKLCGILCERRLFEGRAFIIIGIGINFETDFLPEEIKVKSTGLLEFAEDIDSSAITAGIIKNIFLLNTSNRSDIVREYRDLSSVIGREVYWSAGGETVTVNVIGYDENCNLVVSDGSKTYSLNCGDVSVTIK